MQASQNKNTSNKKFIRSFDFEKYTFVIYEKIGQDNIKKSKYRGVYWDTYKNQWKASIKVKGKYINLLSSDNELDCAKAYNNEAIKIYGDKAILNEL